MISNIYPGDAVIGFSIILICAFGFKLVFVLFSNYFELKFTKIIKLNFTEKLFSIYLEKSYSYFVNINTAEISRNIIRVVGEAVGFLVSCITILREFFILLVILVLLILHDPVVSSISFISLIVIALLFYLSTDKILKKISKKRMFASKEIFKKSFNSWFENKIIFFNFSSNFCCIIGDVGFVTYSIVRSFIN